MYVPWCYSDLHNRLHNNFAEILENLFAFVCSVTRLSEISRFKPFRLSDLCSGSRLGGQGWLPDARQTRRHAQAPQRKRSPARETTRTTECCADARVLRASNTRQWRRDAQVAEGCLPGRRVRTELSLGWSQASW